MSSRMIQLDTDLLELLPPWYREILDYQEICQTEEAQFEALAAELSGVADNFFFQTMDAGAVSMWEQILGIVPDLAADSLSFRRGRVLNRISTRPPYTLGFLCQRLDALIGAGAYTVTVDYPNYTLYIESSAENQQYATEVAYTVNQTKPAHIVYVNTPYLRAGIQLSESIELSKRVFNYRLGSWGLGVQPFAMEQSQGVIKTAEMPSIQSALLSGVAGFVSEDVVSARINGTTLISELSKSVDGSTLTITYTVTEAQADTVTQVELLDVAGNVLTASSIYVPVSGATILKHIIPVSEGVNRNG